MIESGTILQERFSIEERIGEGGMGAVYRAVDQKFGTTVAVKETFFGDRELGEAFEREARLLNGLHHPIIPHVSDHFTEGGGHFLVMEYIEGDDMSDLLKRGEVFPVDDVVAWTLELLDGLDYLHSLDPPIIHRDIKPNNLKLTSRGNIVLLDFGMAKESASNTQGMRSVFGYSRRYSPLEQIEGTGTDPRSDIFSLGATVFHLFTGRAPIDVLARATAIVSGREDPLQSADVLRPDVPGPLAAILDSALALNPEHRFVSARAMSNALEYALGVNPEHAEVVPVPVRDDDFPAITLPAEGEDFTALQAFKEETTDPAFVGGLESLIVEDEKPVSRAVIHLDDRDDEGDQPETSTGEVQADEDRDVTVPVARNSGGGSQWRGSSAGLWIPLLVLLAVLGAYGIYNLVGGTNDSAIQAGPAEQEPQVATEPAVETPAANSEQRAGVEPNPGEPSADVKASDVDRVSGAMFSRKDEPTTADENEENEETEEIRRPASASRREVRGSDREERTAVSEPVERRETATRGSRSSDPAPVARQPRRQRSTAERPRIAPVFDEPGVVSIETILTGIPYERRGRWRERLERDDEREYRRWVRRERRRNERRDFPPF